MKGFDALVSKLTALTGRTKAGSKTLWRATAFQAIDTAPFSWGKIKKGSDGKWGKTAASSAAPPSVDAPAKPKGAEQKR